MKTKNILFYLSAISILFFASCKKDEAPGPMSFDEATAALTSAEGDYHEIIAALEVESGPSVQDSIDYYGFPFTDVKKSHERADLAQLGLTNIPSYSYEADPYVDFEFNDFIGTWTYNTGTHAWDHISTPSGKVVVVIPYGEGLTATITYSDYESDSTDDGVTYTTQLQAELAISSQPTPVMTWVYSATRSSTTLDYTFVYTFGDYTKTRIFSIDGFFAKLIPESSKRSSSTVWKKNGEIIYAKAFNSVHTFTNDQSYTVAIDGKLRVKNIVVKWFMDYDETTDQLDPNNFIKISVWTTNGTKVADIFFKTAVKADDPLYLKFTDGSEAPLRNYITEFGDEIENFTSYIRNSGRAK